MKILESYKKIAKSMLTEHAWDRKFGEPLPTLEDVMAEADVMDKTIKYKDKDGNEKEATVGGILKKGEDHPAYDDAKQMADKGGEEEPKSKGLEPDDFERDFDDSEPEDKPFGGDTGKDADYGGGDFTKSADYDMWSDDEPQDDKEEPSGERPTTVHLDYDEAEENLDDARYAGRLSDFPDLTYNVGDMVKVMQSGAATDDDVERAQSIADTLDDITGTNEEDPESFEDLGIALQSSIDQHKKGSMGRTGRELETISINGQKYRPIKDSVEPKKHLLREMYERIGGK